LIAGVLIVIGALGSQVADPLWLGLLAGLALLVWTIPQIHRYQAPADGPAGVWGSRLVVVGGGIVVLLGIVFLIWEAVGTPPEEAPGPINALWPIGFFSFLIGIVLCAIGSIRAKVLPAAAFVLMLVGLVLGVAIDMATGAFFEEDGETTAWGLMIGMTMFGVGVAWLGYTLWGGRATATTSDVTTAGPGGSASL
jgi:hypothetical protein